MNLIGTQASVSDIIGQGVTNVLDVTPIKRGCYVPGNAVANARGGGFTLFSEGGDGDDGDGVFWALCNASACQTVPTEVRLVAA